MVWVPARQAMHVVLPGTGVKRPRLHDCEHGTRKSNEVSIALQTLEHDGSTWQRARPSELP